MRSIIVATVLLLVLLTCVFYYVCFTPALVSKAIPAVVEKYFPNATLQSLHIGGQSFKYSETLKLSDITAQVQWNDRIYQFDIDELNFTNFMTFTKEKKLAALSSSGFTFKKDGFEIHNAAFNVNLQLGANSVDSFECQLLDGKIDLMPYQLTNVQAKLQGSKLGLTITEIKAQAYGGQTKGQIKLTFSPKSSENIEMEFNGVKSDALQVIYKTIFSQLTGEFNGKIRLSRVDQQIQVFAVLADMSRGGTMKSTLAKKIINYMTDEENRYDLTSLLEKKGEFAFDAGEFRILNVNQNIAAITVTLNDKKQNLRVHETINMDISRVLQKTAWKN
ncbi:MAG: hypothetical protein H6754_07855 [Candidatus Omnitrophica bacterium]|nr:hypothetical protein [Candidatus Omnitrophota bacterium]